MSEKAAYLRLDRRESVALIEWYWFQEQNDIRNEKSSITDKENELLDRMIKCVMKMKKDPKKFIAMRLSPESCQIAFDWFRNLPPALIDPRDADIHVALGMFLNEQD